MICVLKVLGATFTQAKRNDQNSFGHGPEYLFKNSDSVNSINSIHSFRVNERMLFIEFTLSLFLDNILLTLHILFIQVVSYSKT